MANSEKAYRPYSKSELEKLFEKAKQFNGLNEPNFCDVVYRNKPAEYFSKIKSKDGIMKKCVKDLRTNLPHGDPRSPINNTDHTRRPQGLFFGVHINIDTGEPHSESPYGNVRIVKPIDELIDRTRDRVFFADFYCCERGSGAHIITLIVTKADTSGDNGPCIPDINAWCAENLLEIPVNLGENVTALAVEKNNLLPELERVMHSIPQLHRTPVDTEEADSLA